MKIAKNRLVLPVLAATLGLSMSPAMADRASDIEALLNWAETTYPHIFPVHKSTQATGPWIFRFYVETGVYAGVNINDNGVYVMGGPWGMVPTPLGPLATYMERVNDNGGNDPVQACNAATLPQGMTMTQNGNTITITTGGNCIKPPLDQNYCDIPVPTQPVATGISVLSTTRVTRSELRGFTFTSPIPGMPNPAEAFLQSGNFKSCIIHAPTDDYTEFTVNMDVCYDLTDQFGDIESNPFITITPPVTQLLQATSTTEKVADCFATDADSISNLVTDEHWIKNQNGTGYTKL